MASERREFKTHMRSPIKEGRALCGRVIVEQTYEATQALESTIVESDPTCASCRHVLTVGERGKSRGRVTHFRGHEGSTRCGRVIRTGVPGMGQVHKERVLKGSCTCTRCSQLGELPEVDVRNPTDLKPGMLVHNKGGEVRRVVSVTKLEDRFDEDNYTVQWQSTKKGGWSQGSCYLDAWKTWCGLAAKLATELEEG